VGKIHRHQKQYQCTDMHANSTRGGSIRGGRGGAIEAIAPSPAANFLNVVCDFSVKFFLFLGSVLSTNLQGKKANLPFPLDVQTLTGF